MANLSQVRRHATPARVMAALTVLATIAVILLQTLTAVRPPLEEGAPICNVIMGCGQPDILRTAAILIVLLAAIVARIWNAHRISDE